MEGCVLKTVAYIPVKFILIDTRLIRHLDLLYYGINKRYKECYTRLAYIA
jgi:hypothetical protein